MKLCSLLILATAVLSQYTRNNVNFWCQHWCYRYDNYGCISLTCCHMYERRGTCPKGCLFGYGAKVGQLLCTTDRNCPIGYKCCIDSCSYFQKICKPIVLPTICEAPQFPIEPPKTSTYNPPNEISKSTEIDTTTHNSVTNPTSVESTSTENDITTHNPHTDPITTITTEIEDVTVKIPTPAYRDDSEIIFLENSTETTSYERKETTTIISGSGDSENGYDDGEYDDYDVEPEAEILA